MLQIIRLSMLLLAAALAPPSSASEDLARALSCRFEAGSITTYAQGSFEAAPAKPLAFDIEAIDLDGQDAKLVTGSGKGRLRIVRAVNANHFLEVVNEGFLNITTIYDLDPQRDAHPAVHSRHFGLLGEPVVAQYVGFCTAK